MDSLLEAGPGIVELLGAVFGGGILGRWLTLRHRTKSLRRESVVQDIRTAQESLMRLRSVYQHRLRDGAAVSDETVGEAENEFMTDYYRVECDTVIEAAEHYIEVGRLFASRDPETGLGDEEDSLRRIQKALAKELSRRR